MSKSPEREESERKNLGVCFRTGSFPGHVAESDAVLYHFRMISPCVCVFLTSALLKSVSLDY